MAVVSYYYIFGEAALSSAAHREKSNLRGLLEFDFSNNQNLFTVDHYQRRLCGLFCAFAVLLSYDAQQFRKACRFNAIIGFACQCTQITEIFYVSHIPLPCATRTYSIIQPPTQGSVQHINRNIVNYWSDWRILTKSVNTPRYHLNYIETSMPSFLSFFGFGTPFLSQPRTL